MPNRITLYEFKALPEQEQLNVIFTIGKIVEMNDKDNNEEKILYSVDRFFVEFHYSSENPEIKEIYPFEGGSLLDKYSIDLQRSF
ncbi:hypothetical protein FHG64_17820 [Antarcticibacterium flavum]|uniref:Uncharacterized protein n=1 Tax=Antarcticibacterium flavum TaxID=2058175 RepID=A0A5B7X8W8_9FLAO|nr:MULTISPECIES: hypothetical protein [Antarcticibacterium]MCM4160880.1 hypothetical protein [Antarcticibacterium sp. W02-3]QCY71103.1 hypothetical protein FHG64_17820 [Antarcticibacterium flavum]